MNLKKYKAIAGEVGLQDTLKASNGSVGSNDVRPRACARV